MVPMPELQRIAAAYPPEARHVPGWERRAYMTEVQQLAWLLRFDPEAAADVLSAAGMPITGTNPDNISCSKHGPHVLPHHEQPAARPL